MREADKIRRRAVIFDRDGVLNVDHGYVGELDRFEWIEGAREAIGRLNREGLLVIVVTNQSGVARGLFTEAAVDGLHAKMRSDLAAVGAHVDAFYVCPFHAEASIPDYRHPDHPDRKPNPGMILRAIQDWNIDPAQALMIGDKSSDLEAARRAGIAAALFAGGNLARLVEARAPWK